MTNIERPLVYKVPKSWCVHTVNEIRSMDAHSCVAGPFGSKISSKFFVDDGVPVIRGSNLRDDLTQFVPENFVFISETKAQEFRPQLVKGGDLIFTCWGTIGQVGLIPENGPYPEYIISNKQLKLRVNQKIASPLFCFYYFASPLHVEHVRSRNIGGAVPGINLGILKSFRIALPPIKEQKRLIELLGSYDDLIENNRRRMALLEDAARQVYQEWFVRLRFPGYEHTRIVDGVPEGWERKTAFDAIQVLSGGTPKTTIPDYWDGEFPFYTPKDASEGVWVMDCERTVTELGLKNCNSKLYPKETVFISARGTVGKLNMAQRPMAMSQSCYALVGRDHLTQSFVYSAMQAAVESLRQQAVGAVFDAIIVDTFKRISLLTPEPRIVKLFDETIHPIFEQVENLLQQNQKLRTARDLLLPKLMSGEISV